MSVIVIFIVAFTVIIITMGASGRYAYAEKYAFIRKWGTPCSIFNISPNCNTKAPGAISIGDGQFNYPTGVAVLSVDNVYVTDRDNMRVQKFAINGQFQGKWGTICIMNTTHGCNTSAPGAVSPGDGQFYFPAGIAIYSSRHIYIADTGNNRIQWFDSNGRFLGKFGSFCNMNTSSGCNTKAPGAVSPGDGQFLSPWGIAVDPSAGLIYVADTGNHRIEVFDTSGRFVGKWGSKCDIANGFGCNTKAPGAVSPGDGQFLSPFGIGVNSTSHIVYVADTENNRIQAFSRSGIFLFKWGLFGSNDSQFDLPYGIIVDSQGNVYVSDSGNHRIQKFSSTGKFNTTWGSLCNLAIGYKCKDPDGPGPLALGDGQFHIPFGITVDTSSFFSPGRVYVADRSNHRIQVFAPDDNPPDTTITSSIDGNGTSIPNGGSTSSTSINFKFTGTDNFGIANFTCSIDGSNPSNCASPITYTNLNPNIAHTFQVYSTDIAGNVDPSPSTFIWTIVSPSLHAKHLNLR
jgi:DNA-binding beta-propeller fold protein YncE